MMLLPVLLLAGFSTLAAGGNVIAPSSAPYETFDDKYSFQPTLMSWADASKECHIMGNELAFPKTKTEADSLMAIMADNGVDQVHIGFHDQFIEGTYFAAKGRMMNETSFNQWAPGAPTGGTSNNCGGLTAGGLVDVRCEDTYPSICETKDPEVNGTFKDYDKIEGIGFYKHYSTQLWPDGVMTCQNDGTHLLIFNSEAEFEAIFNKYGEMLPTNIVFLGVEQILIDRQFYTILGQPLEETGFVKWKFGEPSGTNSNYAVVFSSVEGFSTASLSNAHSIICEHPL